MPVQINITGADAAESLRELSALSFGLCGNLQVAAPAAPVKEEPKARRTSTKSEPSKPEKAVEDKPEVTKKEEPQADPTPETDSTDESDSEDIPDDVALREAATEKSAVVGKAKIKALLDKYGAKNVTAIPNEQRLDFLRELTELSE